MPIHRPLVSSIAARLLLGFCATVAGVLAFYGLMSLRSAEAHFAGLMRADAERCSTLIRRATRDAMLLNRKQELQAEIAGLAGATVAAIRIYDPNGHVAASSLPAEVGQRRRREAVACAGCHGRGTPPPANVVLEGARAAEGIPGLAQNGSLRHLSVIRNEPDCVASGCHARGQSVLGILDVQMSSEPYETAVREAKRRAIGQMAGFLLLTGAISAVFVHRVVHRPVVQLLAGTARVARGDLAARIEVSGDHELGQLAFAFNRMTESLDAAHREITRWSHTLEEKVIEKTGELQRTQQRVMQIEKMASLGKLAATVAHELNNPLAGVVTYARLIERELASHPLPEATRAELDEYLHLIQHEVTRCGGIVRDLLLFAHPHTSTAMAPVDVNEVVRRSLQLTRHHLEVSDIELAFVPLAGDATVVCDPAQLEQALVALVVNAVEAMGGDGEDGARGAGGGGELRVEVTGDRDEVRIAVADTGVGIHPEVLPHIFEPFFSTKERESGVGLGLAVVYGIVHRHGGTIDVDSTPGRGSVFHLRLPRRPRATPPAAAPVDAAAHA